MSILSPVQLSDDALAHYGLREDPFADPEPGTAWAGALDPIRRQITTAVRRQQMIAVVGEPGAGKSTLLRTAMAQLRQHARCIQPSTLARGRVDTTVLTEAIVRELAGRTTSSMSTERRSFILQQVLTERRAAGDFPVLIIDEAHRLRTRSTEREPSPLIVIKTLWDSSFTSRNLAVVLAGQPPLEEELLNNAELVEVRKRVAIIRMPRLVGARNGATAADYLHWRLQRVGGALPTLFAADAIAALNADCACPLDVHVVASRLLAYAHSLGRKQVEAAMLARC